LSPFFVIFFFFFFFFFFFTGFLCSVHFSVGFLHVSYFSLCHIISLWLWLRLRLRSSVCFTFTRTSLHKTYYFSLCLHSPLWWLLIS
jgi:hypothetical protein